MKKRNGKEAADAIKHIKAGTSDGGFPNGVTGYSGKKLIATLRALTKLFCTSGNAYLELGVFQGFTLLSNASLNRGVPCYGIDNFSLFDEEKKNLSIVKNHITRLKIKNITIIDRDFDEALDSLGDYIGNNQVGVFFVDGPHDYRSQLVPLLKIIPYLAEECAIVVDDANYPHVRQATNDFLKTFPDFALLAEAYTKKHIANMNAAEKEQAIAGWWNGVNIMVRDPMRTIKRTFAKEQQRSLHFSSHDVFRHEFAELAPELLKLAQHLLDAKPSEEKTIIKKMRNLMRAHRAQYPGRFSHQNTYSDTLPQFKLHI